ncbi:copper chaperone [Roseibium sp. M-1]
MARGSIRPVSAWRGVTVVSFIGFIISAWFAGSATLPALCSGQGALGPFLRDPSGVLQYYLATTSPLLLVAEWLVMLAAMMSLLLTAPITHVRRSSAPARRWRATAIFCLGYGAVWTASASVLICAALAVNAAFDGALAVLFAVSLALLWSACPLHRLALNRSHRFGRIGLRGFAADRDCLRFGGVHAAYCIASCWAWMLVPLSAGDWHFVAMVFVTAVLLTERLTPGTPPRWQVPPAFSPRKWANCWAIFRTGVQYG